MIDFTVIELSQYKDYTDSNLLSDTVPLIKVDSSNIRAIGVKKNKVYVYFTNDSVYEYAHIPKAIAKGLFKAESKGKYFAQHIKVNKEYTYKKIENFSIKYNEV